MSSYRELAGLSPLVDKGTPQNKPLAGRESEQIQNRAGGYVFGVNKWVALRRFIVLGSENGSYYADARELTMDNVTTVKECVVEDGVRVVDLLVKWRKDNIAPKTSPMILTLALCILSGNEATTQAALNAVTNICWTATQLFELIATLRTNRNISSRALRRSVHAWYHKGSVESTANQIVKYRSRNGMSHADVLKLAHIKPMNDSFNALFKWVVGKGEAPDIPIVEGYVKASEAKNAKELTEIIRQYHLPRESVPNQFLNDAGVWEALLEDMPLMALIRNLPKMTQVGLIAPFSDAEKSVADRITDRDALRKHNIHPVRLFLAAINYSVGNNRNLTWTPSSKVLAACEAGYLSAFNLIEPVTRNIAVAIDVSGSMSAITSEGVSATTASAALAVYFAHKFTNVIFMAFDTDIREIVIRKGMTINEAVSILNRYSGGTNVSLPARYLAQNKIPAQGLVQLTDNETWAGLSHVSEVLYALHKQRDADFRVVNAAMTATRYSVLDPLAVFALEAIGFDGDLPDIIARFVDRDI